MYYKYTSEANEEFNSAVIKRGWRRFGNYYFHPICNGCSECKSVRIDVENFKLTKSLRRIIKRNKNIDIFIQSPTITSEHLNLYHKYHYFKHHKDGWRGKNISAREYFENFVEGAHQFGKEVLFYDKDRLIGVDLIDILDDGISAIYFFYDPYPPYDKLSLGIFSLLVQIKLAKMYNKKWIYLGYWVDGCKAFKYKERFEPMEILEDFPPLDKEPNWKEWKKG